MLAFCERVWVVGGTNPAWSIRTVEMECTCLIDMINQHILPDCRSSGLATEVRVNTRIKCVGKSQSCMVYQRPINSPRAPHLSAAGEEIGFGVLKRNFWNFDRKNYDFRAKF